MGLRTYNRKRDFKNTPEPKPAIAKASEKLTFVVQRHEARRLHYDFRLELNSVLKSWAVPKGPSMKAGEKRLAVLVEDHPLEYGKFYGNIPEGNYGAGNVDIWDYGTYVPLKPSSKSPIAQLNEQFKKGDLKFVLKGKNLKGAFALVRMNDSEGKNWLLIKKQDAYSEKSFDIEKIKPIKTKKKTSQSAQKLPVKKPAKVTTKTTKSKAHTKISEVPLNIWEKIKQPMLATLTANFENEKSWIYEMKYDGYRAITKVEGGQVEMLSRNGNSFNTAYAKLVKELELVSESVVLDGEVVLEDPKGKHGFQLLQNYQSSDKKGNLKYYIFDILFLNGHNLISFPLYRRKELLNAFFENYDFKNIINAPYIPEKGKELFDQLTESGHEGIIAKNTDSIYQPGKRSDNWLKIKSMQMQEAVICGYTLPQNSRQHFGSLVLGLYENDQLVYIGNCGTGFTEKSLADLSKKLKPLETNRNPFGIEIKMKGKKQPARWVKPKLVCNVKFLEWTDNFSMRNPVFMGLRSDKDAKTVIKEEAMTTTSKTNSSKYGSDLVLKISGKTIKVTNPDKLYWKEDHISKLDLINYYRSISSYILPYLKNRPLSLHRHPNGYDGKSFYHKDMERDQLPDWIKTVKIYSKSTKKYIDYFICNNEASLIYLVNMGCIEINPWHSVYSKPQNPTYLMLDLDPGEIAFTAVVDTALVIKELCDRAGIKCFCKTSGATGLHVYIPLGGKYNDDEVLLFAELLATLTYETLPRITSIVRSVAKRKDKVYVDFLQNRKGQTLAAAYSARPRPGATVSAPLMWNEVNHELDPRMFNIFNMIERVKKLGDLWEGVTGKGINLKSALLKLKS